MSLLSHAYHHVVDTTQDHLRLRHLRYTPTERHSLLASLRCPSHETNVLEFHVYYLNSDAFRWALREVFFDNDYAFDADTDSPTILDCGANIGLATLYFKHRYPRARITCFEADPTTACVLQKNVDQNHLSDVSVNNLMLTAADGEQSFYVDADAPGSLIMSSVPNRVTNCHEIVVRTGKLSDYITGPVDLLKMDVEGAEYDVLRDLKETGKLRLVQRMILEYHHRINGETSRMASFLSLLEEEGFEYQLAAKCYPIMRQNFFQDVLIGAHRRAS